MPDKTYEAGIAEGRLRATENMLVDHKERLDHYSMRIRRLDTFSYILLGVFFAVQFLPMVQDFLNRN